MESGNLREDDFPDRYQGYGFRPIQGMESVVATVSGYHGTERFKLIKLVAQTGANYVGAMTRSTTHLVCWQFEGKKYNLARSTGAHIISHRWFEDCLMERKRLPEDPYSMQSGQVAGPITWEVPAILDTSGKEKCILSTERHVSFDNSNASNFSNTVDIDASYPNWPESNPLNKCKESSPFSYLCSSSNKRNLFDATQDDVTRQPARRSRRLKKKAYCNLLNYMSLGQKQGACEEKCTDQSEFVDSDSTYANSLRKKLGLSPQGINMDIVFSDNEGSGGPKSSRDCNALSDNGVISENDHCENISKRIGSSKNGLNNYKCHKEDDNLCEPGAYKAEDLSCVICWTNFCTTRAALPCGHRFCYSCIQGWADCMASRGKVSTCPLCKASFTSIRKMEDASTDQKTYSQTIPCGSSNMDIFMLSDKGNDGAKIWMPMDSVCYECHNREPEDLLLCCHICQSQWVHSYCLDPPLIPWTCIHCRDLRMLYQRFR